MPIKKENLKRYPPDWREISRRIRFVRAQGRCECTGQCGLHDGERCVERDGIWAKFARGKVVLTVAHLDHDTTNSDESNFAAMCQRCHLRLDRPQHQSNARRTRRERLAIGELFR
jgi:hypothetical protein